MTSALTKQKMTIYIVPEAYALVKKLVEVSDVECSMLGVVERHPIHNSLLITKIFVPYQTRASTETTINADKLQELMEAEHIDHQKVKCWFHSHVNMGVSPSGQDEKQAAILMDDSEWFIRGIFNKRHEYSLSVHWMGVEIEAQLEVVYTTDLTNETVKALLTERTIASPVTYNSNLGKTSFYNRGLYGYDDASDDAYGYYGSSKRTNRFKKNKKKIKRESLAEFKKLFPGGDEINYLNYLRNNENDFEVIEDLEDESSEQLEIEEAYKQDEVTGGEVVWQTA